MDGRKIREFEIWFQSQSQLALWFSCYSKETTCFSMPTNYGCLEIAGSDPRMSIAQWFVMQNLVRPGSEHGCWDMCYMPLMQEIWYHVGRPESGINSLQNPLCNVLPTRRERRSLSLSAKCRPWGGESSQEENTVLPFLTSTKASAFMQAIA